MLVQAVNEIIPKYHTILQSLLSRSAFAQSFTVITRSRTLSSKLEYAYVAEFQTKTACFIPLKLHWKTTHQPLKAWYSAMEVYCGTRDLPASLAVLCSHTLSSSCLLHSQLCSKTHRKTFKYSALATLRIQIPASNSRSKQSLRIGTLACRTCHKSQSQASLRERVKDEIIP